MTSFGIIDSHPKSYIIFDNLVGYILFCIVVMIVVTAGWGFLYALILAVGRHYWPNRFKTEVPPV
jgi:hypothetical protein